MELSEFLNTRYKFPELPTDFFDNARWGEEAMFNAWIKKYPESDHADIEERLKYIRAYTLRFPDFDGEEWFPSQTALNYYEFRADRLRNSGLSEEEFYDFDILQDAIANLGLSPKATFDFIVYLWNELTKWLYQGNIERMEDRVNRLVAKIDERPNDSMELDIKIGGKHFKFSNDKFIKSVIASFLNSNLDSGNLVETVYPTKREIDYILICTLLQNLPIKHKKQKKGTFSQAERNFGLSVLWLTGELNHRNGDDPTDFCTKENNVTFDKLMRDFKDMPLPAVVPLL